MKKPRKNYWMICRHMNYPIISENQFHKQLQAQIRVEDYRPKINGQRVQCWKGIEVEKSDLKLRNIPDNLDNPDTKENVKDVNDVKVFANLSSVSNGDSEMYNSTLIPETLIVRGVICQYGECTICHFGCTIREIE